MQKINTNINNNLRYSQVKETNQKDNTIKTTSPFPNEIWEKIFGYADRQTLQHLSSVNSNFSCIALSIAHSEEIKTIKEFLTITIAYLHPENHKQEISMLTAIESTLTLTFPNNLCDIKIVSNRKKDEIIDILTRPSYPYSLDNLEKLFINSSYKNTIFLKNLFGMIKVYDQLNCINLLAENTILTDQSKIVQDKGIAKIIEKLISFSEITRALPLIEKISNQSTKNELLCECAQSFVQLQQFDQALKILKDLPNNLKNQQQTLVFLCSALAVNKQFDQALLLQTDFTDQECKEEALMYSIIHLSKHKKFDQAILLLNSLSISYQKNKALHYLCINLSNDKKFDQAWSFYNKQDENENFKLTTFVAFIKDLVEDNQLDRALKEIECVEDLPARIYTADSMFKSDALKTIAKVLAEQKNYEKAIEIAKKIPCEKKATSAFYFIALMLINDKKFEDAFKVMDLFFIKKEKYSFFSSICVRIRYDFTQGQEIAAHIQNPNLKKAFIAELERFCHDGR